MLPSPLSPPHVCPIKILGSPPDGFQGFGRVLLDSVLNVRGSVDLFVEDLVDMTHGEAHSYLIDMDGVSSSAFDGDLKVEGVGGKRGKGLFFSPVFQGLQKKAGGRGRERAACKTGRRGRKKDV